MPMAGWDSLGHRRVLSCLQAKKLAVMKGKNWGLDARLNGSVCGPLWAFCGDQTERQGYAGLRYVVVLEFSTQTEPVWKE